MTDKTARCDICHHEFHVDVLFALDGAPNGEGCKWLCPQCYRASRPYAPPQTGPLRHPSADVLSALEIESNVAARKAEDEVIRLAELVAVLQPGEPHWAAIVHPILKTYVERGKGLSDWWVWSHFAATFGRVDRPDAIFDTWVAERTLVAMLGAFRAIGAYHAQGWLWRLWHRRLYRRVLAQLFGLGASLVASESAWCDRFSFLEYKEKRGQ